MVVVSMFNSIWYLKQTFRVLFPLLVQYNIETILSEDHFFKNLFESWKLSQSYRVYGSVHYNFWFSIENIEPIYWFTGYKGMLRIIHSSKKWVCLFQISLKMQVPILWMQRHLSASKWTKAEDIKLVLLLLKVCANEQQLNIFLLLNKHV